MLEHFVNFSQPQEISDVSNGYKIFIPFPFLTFFSIPSDLNLIFPGQKQANPSSRSGPSLEELDAKICNDVNLDHHMLAEYESRKKELHELYI